MAKILFQDCTVKVTYPGEVTGGEEDLKRADMVLMAIEEKLAELKADGIEIEFDHIYKTISDR